MQNKKRAIPLIQDHKRLYQVWGSMLQRCENKSNRKYKDYGNKGIYVCEEWNNSVNFMNWALTNGYEIGLQIYNIDNKERLQHLQSSKNFQCQQHIN